MCDDLKNIIDPSCDVPGTYWCAKNHLISQYKIIGVYIDEFIENKKGRHTVTLQ
jgi:hypothetical protein